MALPLSLPDICALVRVVTIKCIRHSPNCVVQRIDLSPTLLAYNAPLKWPVKASHPRLWTHCSSTSRGLLRVAKGAATTQATAIGD
jgi:hypothetical protein